MTRIRVNPASLQHSASLIDLIGVRISKSGDDIWRSASMAPSYDGQFGPKVRAIGQSALAQARKHGDRMNSIAKQLDKRAAAFQAVDSAGVKGFRGKMPNVFTGPTQSPWLAALSSPSIAQVNRLLILGRLRFPRHPWDSSPSINNYNLRNTLRKGIIDFIWCWVVDRWRIWFGISNSGYDRDNTYSDPAGEVGTGVTISPPPKTPRKYPSPPNEPTLVNALPQNYSSCAKYARARRPDLGSTQSDREQYTDQAAANYISKFQEKAFQVSKEDGDLCQIVGKGYAVVWEPGIHGANKTYGHIAIVEEIGSDYVIVSEHNSNGKYQSRIPIDKLDDLWLIP